MSKFSKLALALISGAALKVLLCYLFFCDEDLTAFPSNKTLVKETGLNLNTVLRAKKELRELGLLKPKPQVVKKDGTFGQRIYQVYPFTVHQKLGNGTDTQFTVNGKLGKEEEPIIKKIHFDDESNIKKSVEISYELNKVLLDCGLTKSQIKQITESIKEENEIEIVITQAQSEKIKNKAAFIYSQLVN